MNSQIVRLHIVCFAKGKVIILSAQRAGGFVSLREHPCAWPGMTCIWWHTEGAATRNIPQMSEHGRKAQSAPGTCQLMPCFPFLSFQNIVSFRANFPPQRWWWCIIWSYLMSNLKATRKAENAFHCIRGTLARALRNCWCKQFSILARWKITGKF